jgi:hypothetical protein
MLLCPTPNSAHSLLTGAVWSHTAILCDCRQCRPLHGSLSALSQGSWWKAGPRCAALGTAQLLKTPSILVVCLGNNLPSNCLGAQVLKVEAGSQVEGATALEAIVLKVPLLHSSPASMLSLVSTICP